MISQKIPVELIMIVIVTKTMVEIRVPKNNRNGRNKNKNDKNNSKNSKITNW